MLIFEETLLESSSPDPIMPDVLLLLFLKLSISASVLTRNYLECCVSVYLSYCKNY